MSTKACTCGNTNLVLLASLNLKGCTDCSSKDEGAKLIPWNLAEGQKPVHNSARGDRKYDTQL